MNQPGEDAGYDFFGLTVGPVPFFFYGPNIYGLDTHGNLSYVATYAWSMGHPIVKCSRSIAQDQFNHGRETSFRS